MSLARNEEDIQMSDCSQCSPANMRVDCYETTKQQHRYYIRERREEGVRSWNKRQRCSLRGMKLLDEVHKRDQSDK